MALALGAVKGGLTATSAAERTLERTHAVAAQEVCKQYLKTIDMLCQS